MKTLSGVCVYSPKGPAAHEARRCVQRACGRERLAGSALNADAAYAAGGGHGDEVVDQRASDSAPPCGDRRVHRLHLGVLRVELLERPDAEQLAVDPQAEERDGGVEGVGIEDVHAVGRHHTAGKQAVLLEESTDVIAPGIVDLDGASLHARLLPSQGNGTANERWRGTISHLTKRRDSVVPL